MVQPIQESAQPKDQPKGAVVDPQILLPKPGEKMALTKATLARFRLISRPPKNLI